MRCDEGTNPPESQALGRLVAEIGVAPSSPLEYLVFGSLPTGTAACWSRRRGVPVALSYRCGRERVLSETAYLLQTSSSGSP